MGETSIEYDIVANAKREKLIEEVRARLLQGWELQGGPFTYVVTKPAEYMTPPTGGPPQMLFGGSFHQRIAQALVRRSAPSE